ncbi:MAG: DNA polymerase domain-containing protein [Candidatus Anstonellales archaeon]
MDINTVIEMLEKSEYEFYNFYNIPGNVEKYYSSKHYSKNKNDNISVDQKISFIITDIEVYTDKLNSVTFQQMMSAIFKITSISCYYNIEDKYTVFFLGEIKPNINKIVSRLKNDRYIDDNINLDIIIFDDEIKMLKSYFEYIREKDPLILTGFNSDEFDYPYLFNRIRVLYKDDPSYKRVISRFGENGIDNNGFPIEYTILDIMRLMKPKDEGGFGYGKRYHSYSLDSTAERVLGLNKVSHVMSLDELYDHDKYEYMYYNLVDVILTKKINDAFRHIELHNTLRRALRSTMSISNTGISNMIETFIVSILNENNKYYRFGIGDEKINRSEITEKDIKLKVKYNFGGKIDKITRDDFREVISRYPGAYVKTPIPKVISDGSLIIDLDATSLYPSIILQHNISFDVFIGQVIDPGLYKFIEKMSELVSNGYITKDVASAIERFINESDLESQNKTKFKSITYYTIMLLLESICKSGENFNDILNPKSDRASILLKNYLIPLIDAVSYIHPRVSKDYNKIIYDYIFDYDNFKNYKYIYVIMYPFSSKTHISKMGIMEFENFIKDYIITISGAIFVKHENGLGMFTELIRELRRMRSEYKKKRDEFKVDSIDYMRYDLIQNAIKITMNSIYGVFGLSSFKFSSNYLAQSITLQGKLINKIAQYLAGRYISGLEVIENGRDGKRKS